MILKAFYLHFGILSFQITCMSCTVLSCSVVSDFVTPWTVAHQAPLPMEFSRQEYLSGLPRLSLGDLSNPGIEPRSPTIAGGFFTI